MELLALSYINELYGNNYSFIQDRFPIHTTIICQEWFEDNMGHDNIFLPVKSLDMNVIEHVWHLMKKRLSHRGIFRNNDELWITIRDT
jgi:transposase